MLEVIGQLALDWWTWWAANSQAVRDLALTVGAVLGAFVGVPLLAWRTVSLHRQAAAALRQAETAAQRHEGQAEADRERRITESFTRAVDQLGSERLETRLGAIYALERIARESQRDHWPIMETLTAYVRERRPWTGQMAGQMAEAKQEGGVEAPATDVQAALTVIGRRCVEYDAGRRLDLRSTDLRGARLREAHLERAVLTDAHLEDASLNRAHLERAFLCVAHLESAWLGYAHLEGALLSDAHLEGAILVNAHLEDAILSRAHLERAHLQDAILSDAHLEGADLSGTDVTQEQLDHACGDANTKLPRDLTIRPCAE